ncbi:MATE family efflux transporter [Leucobacter allii]|uniref:MATE family efflux transporter n=1 Tax=Leucobacter allii TaxID=2932247 RepID=A0ABY4FJC9_9MICO|nr:MATE family efflux transporter [Leucobacter allii]UOQ56784.1 MATE family efflux transporter [Leucobacter allii]
MSENRTDTASGIAPEARSETAPPLAGADSPADRNRWILSAAPMLRALLHLSVPMAAALVVGALYNVVNAGFIGAQHSTVLLTAVTLGTPVLGLIIALGNFFGVGGGALVSRLLGAAEHDPSGMADVRRAASFSVWGAALAGALLAVLGLLLLGPLVAGLGADAAATAATAEYVGVLLGFLPVLAASFSMEQIVRAQGAARQAMAGLLVSTAASLVLDVLFILVLHWGVGGVALSMGLANLVSLVYWLRWLRRSGAEADASPRAFTLAPRIVGPVLAIGTGVLLESGFMIVTSLVLNHLAAAHGSGVLAAMGVAVRIAQVPEFLIMGVTMGVLPLLAYAYGKGDRDRLRRAARSSAIAVGLLGLGFAVLLFAVREPLFALFSQDASLLGIGATIIAAQLAAMIANGFAGLVTTIFQATGRAVPSLVMSLAQGALFIPVVFAANAWFGLGGIIWALTISEIAVLLAGLVLLAGYRRAIARGLAQGSEERAEAALAAQ